LGLGTVFSFNLGSDFLIFGKSYFDALDYLTANIMLPSCGLLVAVFTAWIMKESATRAELDLGESAAYRAWQFTMRYLVPAAIVLVFLDAINVIRL
jgi:NSS family neurotransmitter:Na+ symporter